METSTAGNENRAPEKRLGFADAYFVKVIDYLTAKPQCEGDTSRVRDRFELHFRLRATEDGIQAFDFIAIMPQRIQRQR